MHLKNAGVCKSLTPGDIKRYQLRKKMKIDVPRFNTNYMRNSVARRGAIVRNTLVLQLNDEDGQRLCYT